MGKMPKVLLAAGYAGSLIWFRRQLMETMIQKGCQVFACAPEASAEIRAQLAAMGVTYLDLPLQRTGTSLRGDLAYLRAMVRLQRQIKPDLLLSYTIKPVIYGSIAAVFARTPLIVSMITGLGYAFSEESLKQRCLSRLVRQLLKIALRPNRVVFFQNPDDLHLFRSLGLLRERQQAVLINGSGVDLEHYSPGPFPQPVSFLLIARLIRDKGVVEYAEAARRLRQRYPDTRFRLVGWIDDNPAAVPRALLDDWISEGSIEYLGLLKDIRPAMMDSSVFVLPSFYREGTPRTVLEAMAMGRPVVTTDAPGCRETVVPGENGFLVPVKDATALAEAMERFIRDPGLIPVMGAASRRLAEKKYDVHAVNRIILHHMGLHPPPRLQDRNGSVSAVQPAPGSGTSFP